MNVNNGSNFASFDLTKPAEPVNDDMDVDMDIDQNPVASPGPYKVLTAPGRPGLVMGLKFDDNFEEDEAEMSSEEDDDDDDDDEEDVDEAEEGKVTGISAAILLDKSIEETDDAEDEDYVPKE